MVQLATQYKDEVARFIGDDPDKGCGALVDILTRHGVCSTENEGRLAVVPALVNRKILIQCPLGYGSSPRSAFVGLAMDQGHGEKGGSG